MAAVSPNAHVFPQRDASRTVAIDRAASVTIDLAAFHQILELDDAGTHRECSKAMVAMYFAQAPAACDEMARAIAATDLRTLAARAHFLMGSAATLGAVRVAGSCARMGMGGVEFESSSSSSSPSTSTSSSTSTSTSSSASSLGLLADVRRECADAEAWLRRWYAEHGEAFQEGAGAGLGVDAGYLDGEGASSSPPEMVLPVLQAVA